MTHKKLLVHFSVQKIHVISITWRNSCHLCFKLIPYSLASAETEKSTNLLKRYAEKLLQMVYSDERNLFKFMRYKN